MNMENTMSEKIYVYTGYETLNLLNAIDNKNIILIPQSEYVLSDELIQTNWVLGTLVKNGYLVSGGKKEHE
jgi:hypothetical protein